MSKSFVHLRANPQIETSQGRNLFENKSRREGKVFFFARSPDAPTTTTINLS